VTSLFFVSILAPPLKGLLSIWVWIRVIYLFLSKQNKSHLLRHDYQTAFESWLFVCRILLLFQVSYMGLSPFITCLGLLFLNKNYYYYYYFGWLEELLFEIRFGKWSTFAFKFLINETNMYIIFHQMCIWWIPPSISRELFCLVIMHAYRVLINNSHKT